METKRIKYAINADNITRVWVYSRRKSGSYAWHDKSKYQFTLNPFKRIYKKSGFYIPDLFLNDGECVATTAEEFLNGPLFGDITSSNNIPDTTRSYCYQIGEDGKTVYKNPCVCIETADGRQTHEYFQTIEEAQQYVNNLLEHISNNIIKYVGD